jgi:alanyl aminopeptidase
VALRVAARDGDRGLFDTYCRQFESATEPAVRQRFLGAIGSFTKPELQDAALEYALGGEVRINEMFGVFGPVMGTPEGRDRVYKWFTTNYDRIRKRMPPMFVSYMPFIASGCSRERLEAARVFFSAPERSAPGTEKTLAKVADQVDDCVNLREREGAAVAEYLNGLVSAR